MNNLQWIFFIVYLFIDIGFNIWLIKKKGIRPNHVLFSIARTGMYFYVSWAPELWYQLPYKWYAVLSYKMLWAAMCYWWVIDTGINLGRFGAKGIAYIGVEDKRTLWQIIKEEKLKGLISILDQVQLKTFTPVGWFWFKFILAIMGWALFILHFEVYDWSKPI